MRLREALRKSKRAFPDVAKDQGMFEGVSIRFQQGLGWVLVCARGDEDLGFEFEGTFSKRKEAVLYSGCVANLAGWKR